MALSESIVNGNGLSGFEMGVNCIGTVVVVVTVRIDGWLREGDCCVK